MQSFEKFLELDEGLNYKITDDLVEFENRWFYYDKEDEILYGCDTQPTKGVFSFNPVACKVIYDGDEFEYDVNSPICIITYKLDKPNDFAVYTKHYDKFLSEKYGYSGTNIFNDREKLQEYIEKDSDYRILIVDGRKLVASTFDIIDEN